MNIFAHLDDDLAEAMLNGASVPPEFADLGATIDALRSIPQQPVQPSADLAARMAAGAFPSVAAQPTRRRSAGRHRRRRGAAIPLRAQVVAGAALALGGLTTATAAGSLPGPAQHHVQNVIESITPFEFDNPGPEVADDARDRGVDGTDVSEDARELGNEANEPGGSSAPPAAVTPAEPAVPGDPGEPAEPAVPADPTPPPADGAGSAKDNDKPGLPVVRPTAAPDDAPGRVSNVPPGNPDEPGPPNERPIVER